MKIASLKISESSEICALLSYTVTELCALKSSSKFQSARGIPVGRGQLYRRIITLDRFIFRRKFDDCVVTIFSSDLPEVSTFF